MHLYPGCQKFHIVITAGSKETCVIAILRQSFGMKVPLIADLSGVDRRQADVDGTLNAERTLP